MARPGGEIIAKTQVDDYYGIDIIVAQGQWTVLYKDQPVNIRQRHWRISGEKPKYIRTSYPSEKPAVNLAKKLNKYFFTSEFTVKKIL